MRAAIYTRKSHDERADSQLGSIERQRELCESYCASQADEGWSALTERFDDEGHSGGTLRRPALERLLAAVDAGEIDVIVVYKIDRLSRSLRDFLELVGDFERRGVRFVAVTQHFDTTSSTGRLMLNILLSFAQFERELTGERLRDWFAGARARGLWTSGPPPFGYRVEHLRLHVREDQAEVIRYLYRRYPAIGSSRQLAKEVNALGWLNKDGRPFGGHAVISILRNRLYRGDLMHKGEAVPGIHDAIVTEAAWRRVQAVIAESARRRAALSHPKCQALLKDRLWCAQGGALMHVFVHRPKRTYRYYIASTLRYRASAGRFRADDVEHAVVAALECVAGVMPRDEHHLAGAVRRLVQRVVLDGPSMRIDLMTGATLSLPHAGLILDRRCSS